MVPDQNNTTCDISDAVRETLKKLQFAKGKKATNSGFTAKINKKALTVDVDEEYTNVDLKEIAEDLPESAPRFIFFSYEWKREDGRVHYPLVMIYYTPASVSTQLHMMYASSKALLLQVLNVQRFFDLNDSELLNNKWLHDQLMGARR